VLLEGAVQSALDRAADTEHPEILQVTVAQPLAAIDLPSTGITLLVNLLAQDPGGLALVLGEGLSPPTRRPQNSDR